MGHNVVFPYMHRMIKSRAIIISITSKTYCIFEARTFEVLSFSFLTVYTTSLLTIVILLYNRAPELASLPNCNSVPSKQCFPIPPWPYFPASANHYSILNFYEVSLLDSIYE